MIVENSEALRKIISDYHKVVTPANNRDGFAKHFDWCLEHCKGQFTDITTNDDRVWYFEYEQDAIMFSLSHTATTNKG